MKKFVWIACAALSLGAVAQEPEGTSQWGTPTGNPQFPKTSYKELPDPKPADAAAWAKVNKPQVSWGSADARYAKGEVPALAKIEATETLKAWRGERASAQALVWTPAALENLTLELSPLTNKAGAAIEASAAFVRYVMQDNFLTCGYRKEIAKWDSSLVADVVDHLALTLAVEANTVRPVWVTVTVPAEATAGQYLGTLTVRNDGKILGMLNLKVDVSARVLPPAKVWAFHLDQWQNPFAEARYEGVTPWTKEHFEAMRPSMELLAAAGQKVITASIMHKPWGGQTEDYFESMISWTKKSDGTWAFDFTPFDMWIEYMSEILGKDAKIACYSMIPWKMSFQYYDQTSNSMKTLVTETSTPEYKEVWTALLTALSKHLREKGWFDRTIISMDERATQAMMDAFAVIKGADPEFKVSLAGGNHPEIEEELFDYSMASDNLFTPETLKKRRGKGQISTYYTCCAQKYPNVFTYSPPAEAEWIGWFAAAKGYDGYLRWAYNSYTKEPLLDARFRAFQSGDSYVVYPRGRSSIRWERLIDGVEAFEKVRILRAEAEAKKDAAAIKKLDEVLSWFDLSNYEKGITPDQTVRRARAVVDKM